MELISSDMLMLKTYWNQNMLNTSGSHPVDQETVMGSQDFFRGTGSQNNLCDEVKKKKKASIMWHFGLQW